MSSMYVMRMIDYSLKPLFFFLNRLQADILL